MAAVRVGAAAKSSDALFTSECTYTIGRARLLAADIVHRCQHTTLKTETEVDVRPH